MDQVANNSLIRPAWFEEEPWHLEAGPEPRTIRIVDRLSSPVRFKEYQLTFEELGEWQCPSGSLIATSFIMNIDRYGRWPYGGLPAPTISVPTTRCNVRVTCVGREGSDYREQGYLSLRWSDPPEGRDIDRAVISDGAIETGETGIFFVDKMLLSLFDLETFQEQFAERDELDAFMQGWLSRLAANYDKGQYHTLARLEQADGLLANPKNGIASAVLEFTEDGDVLALHFDFCKLHTSGQDGEYDQGWPYRDELDALLDEG